MPLRNHNKTDLRAAVELNKVEQSDQKLLLETSATDFLTFKIYITEQITDCRAEFSSGR